MPALMAAKGAALALAVMFLAMAVVDFQTMYRRLEEFREVWAPRGYETPDPIADALIADYRKRKESLSATRLARLLATPIPGPSGGAAWAEGHPKAEERPWAK